MVQTETEEAHIFYEISERQATVNELAINLTRRKVNSMGLAGLRKCGLTASASTLFEIVSDTDRWGGFEVKSRQWMHMNLEPLISGRLGVPFIQSNKRDGLLCCRRHNGLAAEHR